MAVRNSRILISGAGIAGPTLAYWLQRYGFEPTVVERAPKPRMGGYIFHLHGNNGIEVLKRAGVWEKILEKRRVDTETLFVDKTNSVIARLRTPVATAPVEPSGAQITIKRADVASILYEHTAENVEYIFGDSISGMEEGAEDVVVSFDSGKVRRFDLVVGADGLHSGVRAICFGEEARFKHYIGYHVAAFSLDDYPVEYGRDSIYFAPGLLVTLSGLQNDTTLAVFVFSQPDELPYAFDDSARQMKHLRDAVAGAGWKVPELLDRMESASGFFLDSVAQIRMDKWYRGRVALVGDAAYCPTLLSGFGAQLALSGAYTLAGELMTAQGDHRQAFDAYERELRPYVLQKQQNPEHAARFIPKSDFGLWWRMGVVKLLSIPGVSDLVVKATYGGLLRESFTLKTYEQTNMGAAA